jgi:hypothetical protein
VEVAETLTGLVVGHAVIIKSEVAVAVSVFVVVGVGQAVIWNRGVEVAELVGEAVRVSVVVPVGVAVSVVVVEVVTVGVAVRVSVVVGEEEGGAAVGETDAISLPTVMSTPQTCGRVSVAE